MPIGLALRPLRERYAAWLTLDADRVSADREEAPEQIRAIQLLLRLERGSTPSWHAALAAAASLCAGLCLDPRAEPGGEWFEQVDAYCRGHIRKVTRRGRGAQWQAAAELDGLGVTVGRTQVRALVPGLVTELDKRVGKLQVGGTDVEVDADPARVGLTGGSTGAVLTLFVPDSGLTAGKLMAQTGHAGMLAACLLAEDDQAALVAWRDSGCLARARRVDPTEWAGLLQVVADPAQAWRQRRLVAVRDAGFTEVEPGTVTVIAGFVS